DPSGVATFDRDDLGRVFHRAGRELGPLAVVGGHADVFDLVRRHAEALRSARGGSEVKRTRRSGGGPEHLAQERDMSTFVPTHHLRELAQVTGQPGTL